MKLLTKSDKLISGLKKIEIEDSISLVNYLPYRYEEFFYDDETSLVSYDMQPSTYWNSDAVNDFHNKMYTFAPFFKIK